MRTSVVISSINRKPTLMRLLAALAAQTVRVDEIILIEAGDQAWSTSELPIEIRDHFSCINAPHLSLAAARSEGQKTATGDIVFFLDDDIILRPDYVELAKHYFQSNNEIMAVGGVYEDPILTDRHPYSLMLGRLFGIYADGRRNSLLRSGWADYVRGTARECVTNADWLFGCNFAIRATAFPKVAFSVEMRAWSFLEDVFLGVQLRHAFGSCIRLLPGLKVIHDPPSSGGRITKATLRMRILYRFILWREHIHGNKFVNAALFGLGMVANLLLMIKQERKTWVVRETLLSLNFVITHSDMNWAVANEFIFTTH